MKKILAMLLMTCLILTGCGGGGSSDSSATSTAAESDLEEIDIMLDWYPNAVHAFIYDAIEKGYFEDAGLKVNVLYPSNPTDPMSMAAAGKIDFGFYYQEDIIVAKANENVPLKVVGAVVQEPLDVVCSIADKNIKTPADLKGKTIGYSGVPFVEMAMKEILGTAGLTMDDVEMVNVGFDLMSSMTTGNVDATYGCFINHEIPALEEEGFDMNVMKPTENGVPNYCALMMVTGEKNLEEREDAYKRFLQACQKVFEDVKADPEAALDLMMKNQDTDNFPLTESVERKSFEILLPMMEKEGTPFLSQSEEVWQSNIDWLKEIGMIDNTFEPSDVMVDLLAD